MNFKPTFSSTALTAGALLAACVLAAGCSSAEFSTTDDWETEGEESTASDVGVRAQALFFSNPNACEQYEAENIGRTGGAPTSGGWKLTSAGDNLNVNRQFVSGRHTFTIVARGVAGGGQKPQLKLTLNGYQIGGNITITNTSYTDGWSEYLVDYNVGTGNNKLIKVELANPGSGRSVSIDGISVYCPEAGVQCGEDEGCDSCCHYQGGGFVCNPSICTDHGQVNIFCDQDSDCSGGDICAHVGNNNGSSMMCISPAQCDNLGPIAQNYCRRVCKTPATPQSSCQTGTCTDMSSYLPGWKTCAP